jgi:hypothetical protein
MLVDLVIQQVRAGLVSGGGEGSEKLEVVRQDLR